MNPKLYCRLFPKRVIKINVSNVKFKSFTFPVVIVLFLELGRLCEPTAWSQKSVQFQGWVETLRFDNSPKAKGSHILD